MRGTRAYILSNFLSVAETDDFLDLSCEQVKEWVSSDEIIVDAEENVFEVVLRWSERSESRKRENFRDLFRHIRFLHMSRDYLFQVILSHPLVRDNIECSSVVLNAMKSAFDGTEDSLFPQSPRKCLKTHEDVIVACVLSDYVYCEVFDPTTDMWSIIPSQFTQSQPTSAVSFKGKIYVFTADAGSSESEKFQVFDADQNQWEPCKFAVHTNYYELYKLSCLRVSKNALSKYRKVSK